MKNLRIIAALVIFTLAPALAAKFNSGVVPTWMMGLAVTGFVLAAIVFFLPTHKDIDA